MSLNQRHAANPATSAFVTANAGSGKTSTLVSRVARLLLGRVDPAAILCVTYTKAAAAEMQRRLFERLGGWAVLDDDGLRQRLADLEGREPAAYGHQDLSRARALFARALETPGGLKIQTIHAFCEKLLRRFPLEAGVSPRFRVMEDAATAEIASAARDAVARHAMAGMPKVAEAYAAFAVSLAHEDFNAMFRAFEARREAIAAYIEQIGGVAGLPQALEAVLGVRPDLDVEAVRAASMAPPALDPARWRWAAEALSRAKAEGDRTRAVQMFAVAEAAALGQVRFADAEALFFTKDGSLAKWCGSSAAAKAEPGLCEWLANEQGRLAAVAETVRAAAIAKDTLNALTLAQVYAAEYAWAKQARAALDFSDLIARTHDLLTRRADAAWVLYKLDGGVDHILVDEAQDTAPEQWAIIRALTAEFFVGDDGRDRPLERTVFVVGDEKQSIFSFQGAAPERLAAEAQIYDELARSAGRPFKGVPLLESWRSTRRVLAYVDAVFSAPEHGRALTPGADQLVAHIAQRSEDVGCIDLWELEREVESDERRAWDEPLDATERRGAWRRLADRIAREIKAMVIRGERVHDRETGQWRAAGYGDVLILVRKRRALFEELLRALRAEGVPVAGADRLSLSESMVVQDLAALARFVLYPQDDLTLAEVLRGPLCALDEDSLRRLARPSGTLRQGRLWAELRARAGEETAWTEALEMLEWARSAVQGCVPFQFFSRLLARLDRHGLSGRQRLVTRLGPEAADALDEFLTQVLTAEQSGLRDLQNLTVALNKLDVTVKREMDEPRGEVRIMTAHGAKGLEAPIVFLPETVGAGAARGSPLLETSDGGFLWCASQSGDCEASAAARAWRTQRADQESLRLLYVALTRARDRVIVAGRLNAKAKVEALKGWWPLLDAAFDHPALREEVRTVSAGGAAARRYGPDPECSPELATSSAPALPLGPPPWSAQAAVPEPGARWASPSRLEEEARAPPPSPLDRAVGGLSRFRRGRLIHRLFELLPDITPERRRTAAANLLGREGDLSDEQRAEISDAVFAVLDDPRFAEVFGPGSRAEVALAGTDPSLPVGLNVSGRLDRLVVTPERVLVIDYKTNRPAPDRAEDADPAYLAQMAVYAAVLSRIYPDRVIEAALVWTDGPRLTPLPSALIEATLARLRDA